MRPVSRIRRRTRLRRASARFGLMRRRVAGRRLDQPGEQRRFVRLQVARRLAEVAARRGFDAVIAVAEIDRVQIRVQDVLLGVALFQLHRDRDLAHLSRERAIRRELLEPRELLGQRAAPFDDAAAAPVAPRGLHDADAVDAVVRVEAAILDGEERVDHVRRHAVERHVLALFDEEGEGLAVLPVEDDGALRMRANLGEGGGVVELARHQPGSADDGDGDGPHQDRAHQHAGDQKSSSHVTPKRNASARKNY